MNISRLHRPDKGVSLVEALVALAVMAIGMLGIVGVQSTLRGNSDNAKQRAEAVRLAQQGVEEWRGFISLNQNANSIDFTDLRTREEDPVTPPGSNVSYVRKRTVVALPAPAGLPEGTGLSLVTEVKWEDRTGFPHAVQLSTVIARIDPELPATLVVPVGRDSLRQPGGRHRGIPTQARYLNPATSAMIPPNPTGNIAWRFDNVTSLITLCTTTATVTADLTVDNLNCTSESAFLIGGFIRYALTTAQPTQAEANLPPSPPLTQSQIALVVDRTYPANGASPSCFFDEERMPPFYTQYFCAVPVPVVLNQTPRWSGGIRFSSGTLVLSTTLADNDASHYKVCRYHAAASYVDVKEALLNQNFLVIPAGGLTAAQAITFACPDPPTKAHQPAS